MSKDIRKILKHQSTEGPSWCSFLKCMSVMTNTSSMSTHTPLTFQLLWLLTHQLVTKTCSSKVKLYSCLNDFQLHSQEAPDCSLAQTFLSSFTGSSIIPNISHRLLSITTSLPLLSVIYLHGFLFYITWHLLSKAHFPAGLVRWINCLWWRKKTQLSRSEIYVVLGTW